MGRAEQKAKDQARAAYMKERKIERTTGRCALCYKEVTVENAAKGTKFTHRCQIYKD